MRSVSKSGTYATAVLRIITRVPSHRFPSGKRLGTTGRNAGHVLGLGSHTGLAVSAPAHELRPKEIPSLSGVYRWRPGAELCDGESGQSAIGGSLPGRRRTPRTGRRLLDPYPRRHHTTGL